MEAIEHTWRHILDTTPMVDLVFDTPISNQYDTIKDAGRQLNKLLTEELSGHDQRKVISTLKSYVKLMREWGYTLAADETERFIR